MRKWIYDYLSKKGFIKRIITGYDTHLIVNGEDKGMCTLIVNCDVEYNNVCTSNAGNIFKVVENVIVKLNYESKDETN